MLWKSHTLQIYQFLGKTPEMLFLYFELYGARILNLCDVKCLCIYTPVRAMFVHVHTSQCYVCASTHQSVLCLCIYTPVSAMFVHLHTSQCYVCASTHQSVLCLCIYTPVRAMFVHLHTSQCYVCASTHQSVLYLCIYTPVSAMFVHLHTSQCYVCASTHQSVLFSGPQNISSCVSCFCTFYTESCGSEIQIVFFISS